MTNPTLIEQELFETWARNAVPQFSAAGKHVRDGRWSYNHNIVELMWQCWRAAKGSAALPSDECPTCQGRGEMWAFVQGLGRAPDPVQCDGCHGTGRAITPTAPDEIDRITAEEFARAGISPTAPVQDDDADSGMSGDAVARAEWLWVNLPTRRPWTSLPTHEKALVCHTLAALSPTPETGLALKRIDEQLWATHGSSNVEALIACLKSVENIVRKALSNVLLDEVSTSDKL